MVMAMVVVLGRVSYWTSVAAADSAVRCVVPNLVILILCRPPRDSISFDRSGVGGLVSVFFFFFFFVPLLSCRCFSRFYEGEGRDRTTHVKRGAHAIYF